MFIPNLSALVVNLLDKCLILMIPTGEILVAAIVSLTMYPNPRPNYCCLLKVMYRQNCGTPTKQTNSAKKVFFL